MKRPPWLRNKSAAQSGEECPLLLSLPPGIFFVHNSWLHRPEISFFLNFKIKAGFFFPPPLNSWVFFLTWSFDPWPSHTDELEEIRKIVWVEVNPVNQKLEMNKRTARFRRQETFKKTTGTRFEKKVQIDTAYYLSQLLIDRKQL